MRIIGADFGVIVASAIRGGRWSPEEFAADRAAKDTAAELDRLPAGTQVKDRDGRTWEHGSQGNWRDGTDRWMSETLAWSAPLTITREGAAA
jgi:hypothetical protein